MADGVRQRCVHGVFLRQKSCFWNTAPGRIGPGARSYFPAARALWACAAGPCR